MQFIKNLLVNYLKAGIDTKNYGEINRKIFIINLFGLVGMSIILAMAFTASYYHNYRLAVILFSASGIFYLGRLILKFTGNYHLSSGVILYSLFILMFYLVYAGGVNNTGPLWIFMIAPVTLFIGGFKKGLMDIAVFLLITMAMLFSPDEILLATSYSFDFKLRLLLSFLTVTFLSAIYEYSHQKSYQDIQEVSEKYEQLAKLDPLTQLSNRRDAINKLEYEQNRITRNKSQVGIILCDVDHFKAVNDNFGHEAGDLVLVKLAEFFSQHIRKQDTVARWGGEEFLFVLPDTSAEQASIFAHKIHKLLANFSVNYKGRQIPITVSMGVNEINNENCLHEAIGVADKYLYQAKQSGRNQTIPAPPAQQEIRPLIS